MKLIPFLKEQDYDGDLILIGIFQGTKTKETPYYETKIAYDPLEKRIIEEKSECECWSFKTGRKTNEKFMCKHLKCFSKIILKFPEELE